MRANDGRNAPVLFTQPPAPGVWRPTPPAFLPMAVPWMGSVTPMLLRSDVYFGEPGPPPALTSARYTRDFDEVKTLGSATSTARTPEQTDTALFFSGNAPIQVNAALRDHMTVRHPDISVHAARMFAAVDMSEADAIIRCGTRSTSTGSGGPSPRSTWPTPTAIRYHRRPSWTPLLTTSPYPEYVSGDLGLTRAFTQALQDTLNTQHLQLTLISTAVPGAVRTYYSGESLRNDVVANAQAPAWYSSPLLGHRRRRDGPKGGGLGAHPLLPPQRGALTSPLTLPLDTRRHATGVTLNVGRRGSLSLSCG